LDEAGVWRHRKKDGTIIDAEITSYPLLFADRRAELVLANDITRRKQTEEALRRSEEQLRQAQKMEAVGKLAGGIAHDFNNLVTVINGHTALSMRRLGEDNPLYRKLEVIKEAGDRAASLTRQLLAFSRKQILQPKVLDLNHVIFETNKILQRLIGEDIDLLIGLMPDLGKVKADPGQIEQVLMNISVNARDAMPKGGKLTIETANVDIDEGYASRHLSISPGRYIMLAVSDTGCGMDAQTQARIFEPFFTTKEVGKGTGLGLSTVYGIVKQSGGSIWVYSEVGRGTTFKIYLPCVDSPAEEFKLSTAETKAQPGNETVLLVEDEEMVREMTREILQESGYLVIEAKHGHEALLVAEQHPGPIHLMLSDVVMPQMSGRELAEQLSPIRREMKVLYMSGYTDDAIVHHGVLDEGMAFIEKPFTPNALARKLREVLNESVQV
jgi:signal transduction histidine kinase/ActR/RegA family two-component response regulator